ncbi:MAG: adenine phosphoribosyltransferase [Phycisphaerae bacterium]|nr:adenine phosphoribosyltransferase [Phycisphaerae bacterium]
MTDIASIIRDIPDFPKTGIIFKDITPLLADPKAMKETADQLAALFAGTDITAVAGIEARGFIFGPLIAERLGVGFVPIRKPGKLPYKKIARTYGLEYGRATIEIHTDAVNGDDKVLMIDDLLATGGTMAAACELVEELGATVTACAFVVELSFLPGRKILEKYPVHSLLKVSGE